VTDVPHHLSALSSRSDPGEEYSPMPPGYRLGRTKYVIITGSVMSGLGKGIFSSGLARLLEDCGLRTNLIKIDGYFNEDAGTLSPYRHGEVFVLNDGTECDMDVGTYERFVNTDFSSHNIFTNGRLIHRINELERSGRFAGSDVQFYPHVTGEVIRFVRESAAHYDADFTLVEIGGTVGDEENRTYITAMSDLAYREGERNVYFINLAWIIEASHLREQKSKAAQHGTNLLMQMGIKPNMLVCRCERELQAGVKRKLADRLRLPRPNVIDLHNLETIYHVPRHLRQQNVHRIVLDYFGMSAQATDAENPHWTRYIQRFLAPDREILVGLAGKYMGPRDTYASIHNALEHAGTHAGVRVRVIDVPADEIENGAGDTAEIERRVEQHLTPLSGILVPGGFGRRGLEGKIACIRFARERNLPFLGICYGFQAAMLEFARSCCGLGNANTTEIVSDAPDPVICLLPEQYEVEGIGGTMRLGGRRIELRADSLAARLYGSAEAFERFRHRYEFNPQYRAVFEQNGMIFSGWAPGQPIMQIAELADHAFYLGVQFHPEFRSRPVSPSPVFQGFVNACIAHKATRVEPQTVKL
jgi:CTP synthase